MSAVDVQEVADACRVVEACRELIDRLEEKGLRPDVPILAYGSDDEEAIRFVDRLADWVLSGPHFFVATPLYKTPKAVCDHNKAYNVLDLTELPDDYLPRTNYVPACAADD